MGTGRQLASLLCPEQVKQSTLEEIAWAHPVSMGQSQYLNMGFLDATNLFHFCEVWLTKEKRVFGPGRWAVCVILNKPNIWSIPNSNCLEPGTTDWVQCSQWQDSFGSVPSWRWQVWGLSVTHCWVYLQHHYRLPRKCFTRFWENTHKLEKNQSLFI